MYVPAHFDESRPEVLHQLIARNPLGVLVTQGPGGLDANHIPFILNQESGAHGTLYAHVARANPVWQETPGGAEVLVVFRAEDAYVSPSWYPSKQETHRQVPTWNYRVAHVHGRITFHDDERFVRGVVSRLTHEHEDLRAQPWRMTDAPADYLAGMLAGIIGVEIEITRLTGKFKLGQNRDVRDRVGAGEALIAGGHAGIGRAMLDCEPEP